MDWYAIWQTIKLLRYIVKFPKWIEGITYVVNYYCRKPVNVIVYGVSGAGKTEFVRSLFEEPVSETPPSRTRFFEKKRLILKDGRKVRFYDVPGHSSLRQQRTEVTNLISRKKIKGIINVTTYGYNEVDEADTSSVFKLDTKDIPEIKNEYISLNRRRELEQIKEWAPFVTSSNKIKWVITIVNKADIWENEKSVVLEYYQNGDYYEQFTKTIERVCQTSVFPYCSIISPFANKAMKLEFSERDKAILHNTLKKDLLKIVSGKYK